MIKLKSLLAEGLDVTPYLHPDGRFDWTKFLNSNKTDDNYHLDPGAAKALISSDFREKLDRGWFIISFLLLQRRIGKNFLISLLII